MSRKRKNIEKNQTVSEVTLGKMLSDARLAEGLTIDQIHQKTKIPLNSIQQLENNDWLNLPAEVYTRGFIKSYCRVVNIPYDKAISLFPGKNDPTIDRLKSQLVIRSASAVYTNEDEKTRSDKESRVSTALVVFILFVLATLTISYIVSQKETTGNTSPSASEIKHPDANG